MRKTIDTSEYKPVARLVHARDDRRTTDNVTTTVYRRRSEFYIHEVRPPRRLTRRSREELDLLDFQKFAALYYHHDKWEVLDEVQWNVVRKLMRACGPPPPGTRAIDLGD